MTFNKKSVDNELKKLNALTSPTHYKIGNIDPWDYIISQNMNFLEGNVIKYVSRYKNTNIKRMQLVQAEGYIELFDGRFKLTEKGESELKRAGYIKLPQA